MIDHYDDIISSYEKCCDNLRDRLQDVVYGKYTCLLDKDGKEIFGKCVTDIYDPFAAFKNSLIQWKEFKDDLQEENKILQIKIQEMSLISNSRKNCIETFKENLASQYVQIEHLKRNNKNLQSSLETITRNINLLQKSENWFKNQLHLCQIEKNKLICKIVETKEILYKQQVINEELKKELQEDKEFHAINKLIYPIQQQKDNKNIINKNTQTVDHYNENISVINMYNTKLKEINKENESLKKTLQEIRKNCIKNDKFMFNMEAKCLIQQKSIDQSNVMIEVFEHFKKDLCEKLQHSTENGKTKNVKILEMMQNINTLKIEVLRQKHEKENWERTLFKIEKNFVEMKNIQKKLIKGWKERDEVISSLNIEKEKMNEENKRCRSLEFGDKWKIQDLLKTVKDLENQKQEMSAVHYEELCEYVSKMKIMEKIIEGYDNGVNDRNNGIIENLEEELKNESCTSEVSEILKKMNDLENNLHSKISSISQMEALLIEKNQFISELSDHSTSSECSLKEAKEKIESLQNEINVLNSHIQQNVIVVNKLKEDKSSLQFCLKRNEEILGKVFTAFKLKIENAVEETNNKFFLQRLCSDLKSALKILTEQNKVLKENLQRKNLGVTQKNGFIDEKPAKYSEKYIQALLKQQQDFSHITDSFNDIHVFLGSVKKEMYILQTAIRKR